MKKSKVENLSEEILRKNMEQKQAARMKECGEAVNAVLEKHNCQPRILVQIGPNQVGVEQILALPVLWGVVSK